MEAAGLLALISLGHWLEARARDRAGSAIRELLELAPATAIRINRRKRPLTDAGQTEPPESEVVPVSELKVGQHVLVRPGDRVPIDAVVVEGRSGVDESMISGESLPVTKTVGDHVIGGSLNHDGVLVVRVTRVGRETALAQVVRLVERAQESKPPIQRLADRVSAVFVPTVLVIALLTGVGWYVYGSLSGWPPSQTWGMLAKSVCSVLIIACPCALGLAVPAALMVGTGVGARRGILIRDIDALQRAERVRVIVLDKTGTITSGRPTVAELRPVDGIGETELLRIAASAEQFSPHPLAQAIVRHARERGVALVEPTSFRNEPGLGVRATIDGVEWLVGGDELTGMNHDADDAASTVHVARARDGATPEPVGSLLLRDTLKPDSADAVAALHRLKLRSILLTGDRESVARRIADEVGIDDVRAGVRPDGKASVIETLQRDGFVVAMVGDGINDAPALARADLGIAIGSGSDIAKESGGIVLVGGSVSGVAQAIRLSHATMSKIRQNLFFAFFYNVLAIPLAAFGLLNPLIAAAAMALSDVTVIGNALLLRRVKIED
jgi:Cu+-exporting ATPase